MIQSRPEQPATVLVVDDETAVRCVCCEMLTSIGFSVFEASGGREAVEIYRSHFESERPFSCVLLDLMMPDQTGFETLQYIKTIDPRARILIASGFSCASLDWKSAAHRPDGYLVKPFGLTELKSAMSQIFDQRG